MSSSYPRYSSSYKVTRDSSGPGGGTYYTSSYSSPTVYTPGRTYHASYMVPSVRTYSYSVPSRTSYSYRPSYSSYTPTYSYSSRPMGLLNPYLPAEVWGDDILASRPPTPIFSAPFEPYRVPEQDEVVVVPRIRRTPRIYDVFEDEPELQRLDDRLRAAEVGTRAVSDKWTRDACTPKYRPTATVPIYGTRQYKNPALAGWQPRKIRTTAADDLKPVHLNIAIMSYFDRAKESAEYHAKRSGTGRLLTAVKPSPVYKARGRPSSRFHNEGRVRAEIQLLSLYGAVLDDVASCQHRSRNKPANTDVATEEATSPPKESASTEEPVENQRAATPLHMLESQTPIDISDRFDMADTSRPAAEEPEDISLSAMMSAKDTEFAETDGYPSEIHTDIPAQPSPTEDRMETADSSETRSAAAVTAETAAESISMTVESGLDIEVPEPHEESVAQQQQELEPQTEPDNMPGDEPEPEPEEPHELEENGIENPENDERLMMVEQG